jgi:hypothetical protein
MRRTRPRAEPMRIAAELRRTGRDALDAGHSRL